MSGYPIRPAADRELDARRRAAEILAFAEVQPGDKVADIFAGGGYSPKDVGGPKARAAPGQIARFDFAPAMVNGRSRPSPGGIHHAADQA